jgi:hypothetical protein
MVPDITKNVHRFARDETGINTPAIGNDERRKWNGFYVRPQPDLLPGGEGQVEGGRKIIICVPGQNYFKP